MIYLELEDQDVKLVERILKAWCKRVEDSGKDDDGVPISLMRGAEVEDLLYQFDTDEPPIKNNPKEMRK